MIVGKGTYGVINVSFSGQVRKLYIGNYCSIGPEVLFVPEAEHRTDYVSTFPWPTYFSNCIGGDTSASKGDIIVDDDVWIGIRATLRLLHSSCQALN